MADTIIVGGVDSTTTTSGFIHLSRYIQMVSDQLISNTSFVYFLGRGYLFSLRCFDDTHYVLLLEKYTFYAVLDYRIFTLI